MIQCANCSLQQKAVAQMGRMYWLMKWCDVMVKGIDWSEISLLIRVIDSNTCARYLT